MKKSMPSWSSVHFGIVLAALRAKNGPISKDILPSAFRDDPYVQKLERELRLPRLCVYLLKRHRQFEASKVAAQVDLWLIDHEYANAFNGSV